MTKIVALMLCLVLFITPVFAETIDLSSMSDDELLDMYHAIWTEMDKRAIEKSDYIYPGKYMVGRDILPGRYVIKYEATETSHFWIAVFTYLDEEHFSSDEYAEGYNLVDGDEVFLDLQDGIVLTIDKGTAIIRTNPTPFWAVKK